jgi:hypothetical protein
MISKVAGSETALLMISLSLTLSLYATVQTGFVQRTLNLQVKLEHINEISGYPFSR